MEELNKMKTIKNISIDVEVMQAFEAKNPKLNFSNWVENKLIEELGLDEFKGGNEDDN